MHMYTYLLHMYTHIQSGNRWRKVYLMIGDTCTHARPARALVCVRARARAHTHTHTHTG